MELAIHEARRSVGEEGRVNPNVGAVVVKGGIVLATAHRCEMGKGEMPSLLRLRRSCMTRRLSERLCTRLWNRAPLVTIPRLHVPGGLSSEGSRAS